MSTSSVQVETRGAVALVTLNRPESANTLNLEMGMDLLAAAMTCGRNPAVRNIGTHVIVEAIQPGSYTQSLINTGAGAGFYRPLDVHQAYNVPLTMHITPTLASAIQWASVPANSPHASSVEQPGTPRQITRSSSWFQSMAVSFLSAPCRW